MVARTAEDQTLEDAAQVPAEFWGPTGQSWEQWVERQDDGFQLSLRKISVSIKAFRRLKVLPHMAVGSPALGAYKQAMPLRGMQAMEAQSDDF